MKKLLKITLTLVITIIVVTGIIIPEIILGTPASPAVGNWYQQFMPTLGNQQIRDITFLDSLTGFAVASKNINPDTSSILKTTNGGDNWQIVFTQAARRFSKVKFVNSVTGFISGGSGSGTPYLYKTTNGGNNWSTVPGATLGNSYWGDISVISEDTIWLVDDNSLNGGVYRTTNGGANWDQQLNLGSSNPVKIYMYNGTTGYITKTTGSSYIRKTTDSGLSWNVIYNKGFSDIYFNDNMTGWMAFDSVRKTTNGGTNWETQILPFGTYNGGFLNYSFISKFSVLNLDTLWGVGGRIAYPNTQLRGLIYRTLNGGSNWQYQLPDTGINIGLYNYVKFLNSQTGWAYSQNGIHTTNGGDPVWYTGLIKISENIPEEYRLEQNFPNPFNPRTIIRYNIKSESYVKLTVYDITGKEVELLQDGIQNAGRYETDFMGKFISSGVYFYRLEILNTKGRSVYNETRKMLLVK